MRVSILGFGAACQTTKAFPGGFSEGRKQGGMLCSATWRQLGRLLFKFHHPHMCTGIALTSPWRYLHVYIKYAARSHVLFSGGMMANSRPSCCLEYTSCSVGGRQLHSQNPLVLLHAKKPPSYLLCFSNGLQASVFTNVQAEARDAYTHMQGHSGRLGSHP